LARTYTVRLARGSGDRKRVYDVKLRLPVELAKRLGMRHGTRVVIKPRPGGFTVAKARRRGRVRRAETGRPPPIS